MAKTEVLHTRLEPELKMSVEQILAQIGLSTTEAITMFFRQVKSYGGIPFELRIPNYNEETFEAMLEAEAAIKDPNRKTYANSDELWGALGL